MFRTKRNSDTMVNAAQSEVGYQNPHSPISLLIPLPFAFSPSHNFHSSINHNPICSLSLSLELAANSQGSEEDGDSSSRKLVLTLYAALNSGDSNTVVGIVAPHLEWWFHCPPSHQFLMRLLTGQPSSDHTFRFLPQSIASVGPTVLVEGCDHSRSISWVHAWTVADGIITQVREYLNTSLTVTRFGYPNPSHDTLWESTVSNLVGKSVPGLVLAL